MNTIEYIKMEAREEVGSEVAVNLFKGTDFSVEKIAALVNLPVEVVKNIKNNLDTQ